MDIQQFIESGILEEYCIGWLSNADRDRVVEMCRLHPEVKEELGRIEIFMEQFAKMNAVKIVNPDLREKILSSLDTISQQYLDLGDLPVIDETTDHEVWFNSVKHLIPDGFAEDIIFEPLRNDGKIVQTLVISKINVPEESHTDVLESLLILRGQCECTIGRDRIKAGPGAFIPIPLNVDHDVRILSPVVVAIVQHQMI